VSFVEYLNIPGGQTVVEKRFVERSRKQCLFKKIIKVSKSFVRPFVQPMGRIFGGFPQLSVSLINEKTEINMRMDTHSRLSGLVVIGAVRNRVMKKQTGSSWGAS
jgi:hypothetical protein